MRNKFIFIHKKRDALVFWVCLLAGVVAFFANDTRAGGSGCTPGEKQTMITKWAETSFYREAKLKPAKFLWTDHETQKLYDAVLVKARRRADTICK